MSSGAEKFRAYEGPIRERRQGEPWVTTGDGEREYLPDYGLLEELLAIPVKAKQTSPSGRLPAAVDAWAAYELRRAGFPHDEVYPRLTEPRVVPREVGMFIDGLPQRDQVEMRRRLLQNKQVAPSGARILGRAYFKQVDVVMSQWARGPEILISTKTMLSSFRNNLPNRFEESYGDAKNLRGRHPLASLGFLFLLRSTVLEEPGSLDKAIDMLRKLKAEFDVYDATCLLLAKWDDGVLDGVAMLHDEVPRDLRPESFWPKIIDSVLDRTPVEIHGRARELRTGTLLGSAEELPVDSEWSS